MARLYGQLSAGAGGGAGKRTICATTSRPTRWSSARRYLCRPDRPHGHRRTGADDSSKHFVTDCEIIMSNVVQELEALYSSGAWPRSPPRRPARRLRHGTGSTWAARGADRCVARPGTALPGGTACGGQAGQRDKGGLESALKAHQDALGHAEMARALSAKAIDVTLPGRRPSMGGIIRPLALRDIVSILRHGLPDLRFARGRDR